MLNLYREVAQTRQVAKCRSDIAALSWSVCDDRDDCCLMPWPHRPEVEIADAGVALLDPSADLGDQRWVRRDVEKDPARATRQTERPARDQARTHQPHRRVGHATRRTRTPTMAPIASTEVAASASTWT